MKSSDFDPNVKASSSCGIFGLPFSESESKMVYLPIPWDVTTSYQAGTSAGAKAILKASEQIDYFDLEYGDAYLCGLYMQPQKKWIQSLNKKTRPSAEKIIDAPEEKLATSKILQKTLASVNAASDKLNTGVEKMCLDLLDQGKIPVLVGGDHSIPYGAIKAYAKHHKSFGILHFDAHSDTRDAYMGFQHSHASIMRNVAQDIAEVKKITQVGIRDFCDEEFEFTKKNKKFSVFYDLDMQRKKLEGVKFSTLAKKIVSTLPKKVYISFDIDGLDPKFCPHTGTPVPGGLDYMEVLYILHEVVKSGRVIIGFDLVEVCPAKDKSDEWDANVGMRLLYKLSAACLSSQKLIK